MSKRRAIAIVGGRGIGNYGGFETFVKEVAPLLHDKGIEVYSTCEKDGGPMVPEFKGVKLVYFPISPPKNYSVRKIFEVLYDFYFLATSVRYADRIILLGTLGAPMVFFPRLFGKKVYVNIAGMEWRRDKYSKMEKLGLKLSYLVCLVMVNKVIVDSRGLLDEVPEDMKPRTVFIAYGVYDYPAVQVDGDITSFMNQNEISPGNYWLAIARLEPENNIRMVVEGFKKANTGKKLIVVGNFTSNNYREEVTKLADPNIVFTGAIFNQKLLNYLRQNCLGYLHGHSVGGTNPSLLEAMSSKAIIAAHSNKFNREVMDECGLYFESGDELSQVIREVENDPGKYMLMAANGKKRVLQEYSWEKVAQSYDELTR